MAPIWATLLSLRVIQLMSQREENDLPSRMPRQPRVLDAWYAVMRSEQLGSTPQKFSLFDQPLVLFRGEGGHPGALLDRCPHRSAPLSLGRIESGQLECPYHGWRFSTGGACTAVPGSCRPADHPSRRATSFVAREQQGFIWVYAQSNAAPSSDPFSLPYLDEKDYRTVHASLLMEGSLHATAENALDVPHTAFLHRGLFRKSGSNPPIDVVVRRWHDRVEAEYIGEPRPGGVLGRMLAPQGGLVTHFDRFVLPCVAQVEYRLGEKSHLIASTLLTPESEYRTWLHGVVTFRLPLPVPDAVIASVAKPVAMRVLRQDAQILARQTENIQRFGEQRFSSTELDALGPHILRLLERAEKGQLGEPMAEPRTRQFTLKL